MMPVEQTRSSVAFVRGWKIDVCWVMLKNERISRSLVAVLQSGVNMNVEVAQEENRWRYCRELDKECVIVSWPPG